MGACALKSPSVIKNDANLRYGCDRVIVIVDNVRGQVPALEAQRDELQGDASMEP